MIAAEIKQISSRDFDDVCKRRFPAKGGLRRKNSRSEQSFIPNPGRTTEILQRLRMNLKDNFDRKMDAIVRRRLHASLFSVRR